MAIQGCQSNGREREPANYRKVTQGKQRLVAVDCVIRLRVDRTA